MPCPRTRAASCSSASYASASSAARRSTRRSRRILAREARASILLHVGAEREPQRHGREAETAEQQECRAVADPLRDPAAKRGAEARADTLHGDHGTLAEIDAAGAVERARDHAGDGNRLESGAQAVEHLHRYDAPPSRDEEG